MNDKKHELQINLELLQPILSWFTKQFDTKDESYIVHILEFEI